MDQRIAVTESDIQPTPNPNNSNTKYDKIPKQPKVYFMQPLMVTVRITAVTIWLQFVLQL